MTARNRSLRILIAGAGGGLGACLALEAAARGHRVLAGGRRFAALRQAREGGDLLELALDVRSDESCRAAIEAMNTQFGGIDVVVANAGVASVGAFEETAIEEFRRVMEVNYLGAVRVIRAALPALRAAQNSLVVAVSSLSGLIGLPGDSAYAASKHALEGALESLAAEVSRFGVRVLLLEPGAVATGLMGDAHFTSVNPQSPYRAFNDFLRDHARGAAAADPRAIAAEILGIVESPDGPLRRPVGDQARSVLKSLDRLGDEERAIFARRAAGLEWWAKGEESS